MKNLRLFWLGIILVGCIFLCGALGTINDNEMNKFVEDSSGNTAVRVKVSDWGNITGPVNITFYGGLRNNFIFGNNSAPSLPVNTGYDNVILGNNSGFNMTSGLYNIFLGTKAGWNATGSYNILMGYLAGSNVSSGGNNTILGTLAGLKLLAATDNVFIGRFTGTNATSGGWNVVIGPYAGYKLTTGKGNVIIGNYSAPAVNLTGIGNVLIGQLAGSSVWNGSYNTLIGVGADLATGNITYATAIGYNAQATENNSFVIGSSSNINGTLYGNVTTTGNMSADFFIGNGSVLTGEVTVNMSAVANRMQINQISVAGTEWVSGNPTGLIWVNDDRTGTTANEKQEATLILDSQGTYGLWVNGSAALDGNVYFRGDLFFYGGDAGVLGYIADDGFHWSIYGGAEGYSNRNIIICDYASRNKNFVHSTLSSNPTLFIHSATDPDTNSTQWVSLSHNTTHGIIDTGTGNLASLDNFSAPNVKITNNLETDILQVNSGGSANHTVCWTSNGKTFGYCISVVGVDGTCNCTAP